LDPGRVPPVSSFPFQGELRCIRGRPVGRAISGNHLKGEATLVTTDGQATKYNAVGLLGEPFTNNGDNILCSAAASATIARAGPNTKAAARAIC
jgi:hypothetical protein